MASNQCSWLGEARSRTAWPTRGGGKVALSRKCVALLLRFESSRQAAREGAARAFAALPRAFSGPARGDDRIERAHLVSIGVGEEDVDYVVGALAGTADADHRYAYDAWLSSLFAADAKLAAGN